MMNNMKQVIIGKEKIIEMLFIAYLCDGHILLEGNPGVGKTKLARALTNSIEGEFKRIQFTPDVLPSDITGYCVLDRQTSELKYKQGVAFCNFLLADEINRASPRVQSSLLEAMEEKQVTVDGVIRKLPEPFIVIATQNSIEYQGTYPLPEAQLDRFFMKLVMEYPNFSEWEQILNLSEVEDPIVTLKEVATIQELNELKEALKQITVSQEIKGYIIEIAQAIARREEVAIGVSPRGTIALLKACKAKALLEGRHYVLPDDVQEMIVPVIGHRIVLADHEGWKNTKVENLIRTVIQTITVPIVE